MLEKIQLQHGGVKTMEIVNPVEGSNRTVQVDADGKKKILVRTTKQVLKRTRSN